MLKIEQWNVTFCRPNGFNHENKFVSNYVLTTMIMPKSITLVLQKKSDCNLQNNSKTCVSFFKKSAVILFLNLFFRMRTEFYDFIMGVMVHK